MKVKAHEHSWMLPMIVAYFHFRNNLDIFMLQILFHLVKNVLGNDNALVFNSFWKHMLANMLLLHNFTYFYVAKEDAQACTFMNTATGSP